MFLLTDQFSVQSATNHTLHCIRLTHLNMIHCVGAQEVVGDLLQIVVLETPAGDVGDHLEPQPPGESCQAWLRGERETGSVLTHLQ